MPRSKTRRKKLVSRNQPEVHSQRTSWFGWLRGLLRPSSPEIPVSVLPRLSAPHLIAVLVFAAAMSWIYGVIGWRFATSPGDYGAHAHFAEILFRTHRAPVPHFLYHLLSALVYGLHLASSLLTAGLMVQTAFYGVAAALIYLVLLDAARDGHRSRLAVVFAASLATFLAEPITLSSDYAIGYFWPETYNSPTMVLLKPFALASFLCVAWLLSRNHSFDARLWAALAASVIAGGLSKPSYLICILPAAALMMLAYAAFRKPFSLVPLTLGLCFPAAAVLAWQFWSAYAGVSSADTYHDAIVWAPFKFMNYWAPVGLLPKLALSIVFPLLVLILYAKAALRDSSLQLAWTTFGLGLSYAYLLAEKIKWSAGNFSWSAYAAVFVLFVASVAFWLRNLRVSTTRDRTRVWLCGAALTLHALVGARIDWIFLRRIAGF